MAPALPSVTDVPSWALSPQILQRIRSPHGSACWLCPQPWSHTGWAAVAGSWLHWWVTRCPLPRCPQQRVPVPQRSPGGTPAAPPVAELLAELPGLRFATEGRGKVCVQVTRCHLPGGPWGHGVAPAPAHRCLPVAGTVGAPSPHRGQSTRHPPGKNKIHFFISHSTKKR